MQPNLQPTYLLDVARGERTIFVVVYKKNVVNDYHLFILQFEEYITLQKQTLKYG